LRQFVQVCPKEMLPHLKHPLTLEELAVPAE
jgi:glutamate synthase (NADPH/NADH) large chain